MTSPSTTKKLDELYALIDGIEIAMFTTRRADGQLVSRPMATQERVTGTDLWFVTDISSNKLDELQFDPHVNLAYYKNKSREWVSVAGTAQVTQDRNLIKELYKPDWKAWFGDEGGERNGGPAARAHPRRGAVGRISRREQAAPGRSLRGREGDHHRIHPRRRGAAPHLGAGAPDAGSERGALIIAQVLVPGGAH